MKQFLLSCAVATALLMSGCGSTGAPVSIDFPFFFLQDVDCNEVPDACTFLDDAGSAIACVGSSLYFLDYSQGYVLNCVDLGAHLSCCAASSEGGYAAAASGVQLFYVSEGTYVVHAPVLLSAPAKFMLTKPYGTVIYVVCSDGSISTVSTVGNWYEISNTDTSVDSPGAAAIDEDGSALYVFDSADSTVKKLSTSGFGLLAGQEVQCPVADICTAPGGGVFVAPSELYEAWHISRSSGLRDYSVPLPGRPERLAATSDGAYLYVVLAGAGIAVVDMDGEVEAQTGSYGQPSDVAVSGSGQRALFCCPDIMKLIMVSR